MPTSLTMILDLLAKDKITQHVLKTLDSKKPIGLSDLVIKISSEIDDPALRFYVHDSLQKLLKLKAIDETRKDCKASYTINKYGIVVYEQFFKYGNKKK